MAVRLVAAYLLLVSGVACSSSPSVLPSSMSPSSATYTDQVGNVRQAPFAEASWRDLSATPLALPTLERGAPCPLTPTAQLNSGTAPAAGTGPVYAVGNLVVYGPARSDGLLPAKILWLSRPDYRGPALIRGARIDARGKVYFSDSRSVSELRFELDTRVFAAKSDEGWRYLPSSVDVESPGCYAFQIDGPGWHSVIVMEAKPL